MKSCLLVGLLCLAALLVVGPPGAAQAPAAPFRLAHARRPRAYVPFVAQRNLLIVSAQLNGQGPYNFILDTGVRVSLLLDPTLQPTLHLALGQHYRVRGMGTGEALDAYRIDSVHVALPGGVVGPAVPFLLLGANSLNFSGYVGLPIHGILGADLFRSFVVAIDPTAARLVLTDPTRYRPPTGRRWASLPLALDAGKPYLTTRVTTHDSATAVLRLLLDTGAGYSLALDVGSHPALRFPERGVRAPLGQGLSGAITGYLGRTARVQLGGYSLAALITSFPDTAPARRRPAATEGLRNGSLGYEALQRFQAIIDYPHHRLLLKPSSLYRLPFEQDLSGLELVAGGPAFRRYRITLVQAGSPAAEAGLQVNDEVLFINSLPATGFSLSQLSELLRAATGHRLTLLVRRADGTLRRAVLWLNRTL